MAVTKEDVIQFIENMTLLELSDFIKALEEKFGVQAAMPMMAAARPALLRPLPLRNLQKRKQSST